MSNDSARSMIGSPATPDEKGQEVFNSPSRFQNGSGIHQIHPSEDRLLPLLSGAASPLSPDTEAKRLRAFQAGESLALESLPGKSLFSLIKQPTRHHISDPGNPGDERGWAEKAASQKVIIEGHGGRLLL